MSQTSMTRPGEKQTDVDAKVKQNSSSFRPSYMLLQTQRFGEYTPHYVAEVVPRDKSFKLQSVHQTRTFSLKAPLLSDFSMKKDYFVVYNQCILPFNWEKVFKNPELGSDVPDDAGFGTPRLANAISETITYLWDEAVLSLTDTPLDAANFEYLLRFIAYASFFYSDGSLLANLGCRFSRYFRFYSSDPQSAIGNREITLDEFIDLFFNSLVSNASDGVLFRCTIDDTPYYVLKSFQGQSPDNDNSLTLREFFFRYLEQPSKVSLISSYFNVVSEFIDGFVQQFNSGVISYRERIMNFPLDLRRVHAYNLVCAHFYTNDQIDYIYTAELYRQMIGEFARYSETASEVGHVDTFEYNGVATPYDYLSGHYIEKFVRLANDRCMDALANIFNFHRSLRFLDYFTGSKSRPLALGDNSVDASQGSVNIIDVVNTTQKARFRNAVHRAGQRIENYLREIYGTVPAYDYHDPAYIGHTSDEVRSVENENTGAAQMSQENSVTSVLRSNAAKFAFETNFDRPGIVIGITYYDIPRSYMDTIERVFFHKDRFDDFVPEMQFVGDQAVYQAELGVAPSLDPFSYDVRYQDLKLRYNQACGGFRTILQNWAFTEGLHRDTAEHISPEFIRSRQSDLDKYYIGDIPRYSLATYFHFIVVNTNYVDAVRPLVKKPTLL